MAFPGELNINYYRGDTHEFKIYPQKTDGTIFTLNDYSNATFKIAAARGSIATSSQITGFAQISGNGTYVLCAITPENGGVMDPDITYVYDVQIYSPGSNTYDNIFTLLTGSISVTDDVTQGMGERNDPIQNYQVFYHNSGTGANGEKINDATSGIIPLDSNEYVANQNIIIKNQGTLAKVGYLFVGWTKNINGTGTVYLAGDTHPLTTSDINFYPKWEVE